MAMPPASAVAPVRRWNQGRAEAARLRIGRRAHPARRRATSDPAAGAAAAVPGARPGGLRHLRADPACQHRCVPVEVVSPVLVGRERELAQLRAALRRTAAGEPVVVLLGGEAGVGKSRLLEAAFGGVRRGPACSPAAASSSAARACRWCRSWRRCGRWSGRRRPPSSTGCSGPARRELARLLPELAPDDVPPSARRRAARRSCSSCVLGRAGPARRASGRWCWSSRTCTGPTAPRWTWSPSWCARCRAPGCCCVLTYRSDEVDRRSPLRPLLVGLGAAARVSSASSSSGSAGRRSPPRWRRSSARRAGRRRWSTSSSTAPRATRSSSRNWCAPCATAPRARPAAVPARRAALPGRAAVRAGAAAAAHRRRRRPVGARAPAGRGGRGVGGRAVRGAARGGGRLAAGRRRHRPRLRLPARADPRRRLRGPAAR